MNREKFKTILLVGTLILASYNGYTSHQLANLIEEMENDIARNERIARSDYDACLMALEELEEEIVAEASSLSSQSYEVAWKGDRMVLSVTAVPKELLHTEKMYLKVGDKKVAFVDDTATVDLAFQETYTPMIVMQSDTGVRQESLEVIYTEKYLISKVSAGIIDADEDQSNEEGKCLAISLYSNSLTDDTIKKANVKIVGDENTGNSVQSETTVVTDKIAYDAMAGNITYDTLEGEVHEVYFKGGYATFNLDEYWNAEDGVTYQIYLQIEDTYGNLHTSIDEIGEFRNDKTGSVTSSGGSQLVMTVGE